MAQQKWVYKVDVHPVGELLDRRHAQTVAAEVEGALTPLGREMGWEVVSVVPLGRGDNHHLMFVMKRPAD